MSPIEGDNTKDVKYMYVYKSDFYTWMHMDFSLDADSMLSLPDQALLVKSSFTWT